MKGGRAMVITNYNWLLIYCNLSAVSREEKQINLWGEIGRRAAESAYMDFMNLFGQRGVQIAFCSIAILYP